MDELALVQWETKHEAPGSEAYVQSARRLAAATRGIYLWRNNLGAAEMTRGGFVRYGLANDSPKLNAVLKSADLIGITPHVVVAADVGKTHGIFTSEEIKKPGWVAARDPRYPAQMRWFSLVQRSGGIARFVTDPLQDYT